MQVPSSDFRIARVAPIFKSDYRVDLNNNRSISVLPTVARVFKRLIYVQLYNYFAEIRCWGFRSIRFYCFGFERLFIYMAGFYLLGGGGQGGSFPQKVFLKKIKLFQIKIFFDDDFKESVKVTNVRKCDFSQS